MLFLSFAHSCVQKATCARLYPLILPGLLQATVFAPGRFLEGSGAAEVEYRKRSSLECAVEAVWPIVQHLLKHRGEMFTAYKILPDEKLIEMRQTLVEHEEAIASVLKTRVE